MFTIIDVRILVQEVILAERLVVVNGWWGLAVVLEKVAEDWRRTSIASVLVYQVNSIFWSLGQNKFRCLWN